MTATARRIIATFHPQEWLDDQAVPSSVHSSDTFDVTLHVQAMGREQAMTLLDRTAKADDLCFIAAAPEWVREWATVNPFLLEVQDSIAAFYDGALYLLDGTTLSNPLIQAKHKRWIVCTQHSNGLSGMGESFGRKTDAEKYIRDNQAPEHVPPYQDSPLANGALLQVAVVLEALKSPDSQQRLDNMDAPKVLGEALTKLKRALVSAKPKVAPATDSKALRDLSDRLQSLLETSLRGKAAAEARDIWRDLSDLAHRSEKSAQQEQN